MVDFSEKIGNRMRSGRRRSTQRDMISTGIPQRLLGSIAARGSITSSAATTLGNGEQSVISATITSPKEYDLFGVEPYVAFYVGTVTSANQLPGGASIDESKWQMINMGYNYANWDSRKDLATSSWYIRNISAGAGQVINVVVRWKYLSRE